MPSVYDVLPVAGAAIQIGDARTAKLLALERVSEVVRADQLCTTCRRPDEQLQHPMTGAATILTILPDGVPARAFVFDGVAPSPQHPPAAPTPSQPRHTTAPPTLQPHSALP